MALAGQWGGIVGGEIAAHTAERKAPAVRDPARQASMTSVRDIANGLWGDLLASAGEAVAVKLSVRRDGRNIAATYEELRVAFPRATSRLVVFVPGLMASEASWRHRAQVHYDDDGVTFGTQLERDVGMTSVYVCYNTGLAIPRNGRHLSALLADLVAFWPVPVQELVLVGHSMGGLVIRSACDLAEIGSAWLDRLTHTVSLGAPYLGAPLEKGIEHLSHALALVPETRPVARLLSSRSIGIRQLRHGTTRDEDTATDTTNTRSRKAVPPTHNARHHAIAATRATDPTTLRARLLGDGTVPLRSAHGRHRDPERTVAFRPEDLHVLGGLSHTDLLNHPRVYEVLRRVVAPEWKPAPAPEAGTSGVMPAQRPASCCIATERL